MARYRHKMRGTVYEVVVERVVMQCAGERRFEDMFSNEVWTVYRNLKTGQAYVRPTMEFLDGRFERVADDASD